MLHSLVSTQVVSGIKFETYFGILTCLVSREEDPKHHYHPFLTALKVQ